VRLCDSKLQPFLCVGSQKQSDLGSSGSTRQGNKDDSHVTPVAMPAIGEDVGNVVNVDTVGDEVDSPIKNLLLPVILYTIERSCG